MRKLLIVVSLLAMTSTAVADGYHKHRPIPMPPPRPYTGGNHNILPWVAGGLALGVLGGAYYYNRNRICYDELIGYDRYRGREMWQTICE
jgi:hypothetical protein